MSDDPHRISLQDAQIIVRRARGAPPRLVKGWSVDARIIREILAQPDATSLRAYLGAKEDGEATLVFVGVDSNGKDMTGGTIAEWVWPCPPVCDESSPFHAA